MKPKLLCGRSMKLWGGCTVISERLKAVAHARERRRLVDLINGSLRCGVVPDAGSAGS